MHLQADTSSIEDTAGLDTSPKAGACDAESNRPAAGKAYATYAPEHGSHEWLPAATPKAAPVGVSCGLKGRVKTAMEQLQVNTQLTAETALRQASSTAMALQVLASLSHQLETTEAERNDLAERASAQHVRCYHSKGHPRLPTSMQCQYAGMSLWSVYTCSVYTQFL